MFLGGGAAGGGGGCVGGAGRVIAVAIGMLLLLARAVLAEVDPGRRVALVIGNGAYQNAPTLPNPPNDARAMAKALRGLGFQVLEAEDLDQRGLQTTLADFADKLEGAAAGLFFYAGHGLQVAGENYLV